MDLKELNDELLELKEKDPEKYLQLLKELNEIIGRLNQQLDGI